MRTASPGFIGNSCHMVNWLRPVSSASNPENTGFLSSPTVTSRFSREIILASTVTLFSPSLKSFTFSTRGSPKRPAGVAGSASSLSFSKVLRLPKFICASLFHSLV